MFRRIKAQRANNRGNELLERGQLEEAIRAYQEAAEAEPGWGSPWYNAGLVCKKLRRWQESLEFNRRATAVDPGNQAAWWNQGIAATALGRWDEARAAWRGFGIDAPDGDGPIDLPCGYCPIRLNPDGQGEVVWAHRLDPARASLSSIPFPESGYRWGDVVLNDGAPVGYRQVEGREVPVFNAIELLERSPFATHVARVRLPDRRDSVVRLSQTAMELGGSAEDWTTSTRIICKACSEGRPHAEHDTAASPPAGSHLLGIAARDREHASGILAAWRSAVGDVEVEWLSDGDG